MTETIPANHTLPGSRPRFLLDGPVARWLVPVLLVVVAITMVSLHVRMYTKVGPIDELQHIDYLYRSPAIVAPGDRIGVDAMREEACRGLDYPNFPLPACSATANYQPGDFQEKGYNTASANSPVYYSVTHLFAAAIQRISGVESLVTAGRLVGGLWLGAGLIMAYFAGIRLGAPRLSLAAILVVTACVPAVLYPSSTITPDAATFAVGAGTLWAGLWWEARPQRRWPILILVTALGLLLKMTNIVVLLALGVYMLLRLVGGLRSRDPLEPRHPTKTWLVGGSVLAATAAFVTVGWMVAQGAMTHGNLADIPMNQQFKVTALVISPLVGNLGNWITPLSNAWAPVGNPELTTVLQRLGGLLLSAGLIAAALFGVTHSRARLLAWSCLSTAFIGASAFIIASYLAQSVYVPPPARYGYALVPTMVMLTSREIRTSTSTAVVVLLAVVSVFFSIVRLT